MFEAPCWAVEWDGGVEAALLLLGLEDMESLGKLLLEVALSYRLSLPGASLPPFPLGSLREDQAIVLRDWLIEQYPPAPVDRLAVNLALGELVEDERRDALLNPPGCDGWLGEVEPSPGADGWGNGDDGWGNGDE